MQRIVWMRGGMEQNLPFIPLSAAPPRDKGAEGKMQASEAVPQQTRVISTVKTEGHSSCLYVRETSGCA